MKAIVDYKEELTKSEVIEFREFLVDKDGGGIEEEQIEMIEEVYHQIGNQIYDIISIIDEDKTVSNWITYGYEVDFEN